MMVRYTIIMYILCNLNEDNTYGYVYDNSMRVYNTEGTYIYNEETG